MLTKIILLNCAKYERGVISIDDVASIQIVGRNNLGKTTLISVLNFLYLPSQKDWNFDHNAKETLNFYFKKLDKNYILFEIYKDGYFCVLMKRGLNNDLEYYKINSSYDDIEDKIIENSKLLKFDDIQANLLGNIAKLDTKKYKTLLYGHSKRDKTILWLKENKQTVFSKIYRYLLDITQIDNRAVKESLLVADNREKIVREFTNVDNDNIVNMQRQQKNIERLRNVKEPFNNFKIIFSEFQAKSEIIEEAYACFKYLYIQEETKLSEIIDSTKSKIEEIEQKEVHPLENEKNLLLQEKGSVNFAMKNSMVSLTQCLEQKAVIEGYDDINLLLATKSNFTSQIDTMKYNLESIKRESYTLENIDRLLQQKASEKTKLTKQIDNYENLLIHHISKDENVKKMLASVLSKDVLHLDKKDILKSITDVESDVLDIFDGKIDLSHIGSKAFVTVESLQKELYKIDEEIGKYTQIKRNIENAREIELEIKRIGQELDSVNKQIEAIKSLPILIDEIEKLEKDKEKSLKRQEEIDEGLKKNSERLKEAEKLMHNEHKREEQSKERLSLIRTYFMNFNEELIDIDANCVGDEVTKSIDDLAKEIKSLKKDLLQLKEKKNELFNTLKHSLQKEHALESAFIKEVEEEFDTIKDKEKTISELVQNITNEISAPTKTFLRELEDFEKYIVSVNTAFKKYKVSNIDTIEIRLIKNAEIIADLQQIADINKENLFDFSSDNETDYEQQITILKEYIHQSKSFRLSDLFDIAFVINGKEANLSKQVESTGTDKILKIMLFILIIKNIIIQDEDNRLVVYVDELSAVDDANSAELIRICQENNLIPIFASPDKKMTVQKYYDLQELRNGQIVVDEKRATLWQK